MEQKQVVIRERNIEIEHDEGNKYASEGQWRRRGQKRRETKN